MSRSLSQIYAEAVATRNNYLQISPLNSGRDESKLSVINILTYVMAALIYSYEVLLDVFQLQIAQMITEHASGTPAYYAQMAKYFQYNSDTGAMDELVYDDKTFQIKFLNYDESHRIIAKAAYQHYSELGLVLKICKNNENASDKSEGGIYTELSQNELTAFKGYIDEIKFVGAQISCKSTPGDLLSINATIVYDDLYINETQALQNIKTAIINYIKGLEFNDYVYYQSVIDAMQGAEHIVTISGANTTDKPYAIISLAEFDDVAKTYKTAEQIVERRQPNSGYLTCLDATDSNQSTLIADNNHLIFKAKSSL